MTRKRVRVTFSLGMVFTTKKIPTLTNISRVYLNLNCCEQDDDNVQNDDHEEDMASIPKVPDPYKKVYSNIPT